MDIKKLLIGGFVGGILFFGLGYLIYGKLLMSFMENHAGKATGVALAETELRFLYIALGNLASGFMMAYIFLRANVKTAISGFITAGIIGGLMIAGNNLLMYGTTNVMSKTGMAVDVIAGTVMGAIVGAVVAMVMNMGKSEG